MGDYFVIHGFFWAIAGAVIISIVTTMINVLLGSDKKGSRRQHRRNRLTARGSFHSYMPTHLRSPLVFFSLYVSLTPGSIPPTSPLSYRENAPQACGPHQSLRDQGQPGVTSKARSAFNLNAGLDVEQPIGQRNSAGALLRSAPIPQSLTYVGALSPPQFLQDFRSRRISGAHQIRYHNSQSGRGHSPSHPARNQAGLGQRQPGQESWNRGHPRHSNRSHHADQPLRPREHAWTS